MTVKLTGRMQSPTHLSTLALIVVSAIGITAATGCADSPTGVPAPPAAARTTAVTQELCFILNGQPMCVPEDAARPDTTTTTPAATTRP